MESGWKENKIGTGISVFKKVQAKLIVLWTMKAARKVNTYRHIQKEKKKTIKFGNEKVKELRSHLLDRTVMCHACWVMAYLASTSSINEV